MDEDEKPPTLAEFEARLRAAQGSTPPGSPAPQSNGARASGLGLAWRISLELVSAVGVGGVIGWLLDGWLGTLPLLMVLFLLLGGAAGVMNAYRVVKGYDDSVGFGQAAERRGEERQAERRQAAADDTTRDGPRGGEPPAD